MSFLFTEQETMPCYIELLKYVVDASFLSVRHCDILCAVQTCVTHERIPIWISEVQYPLYDVSLDMQNPTPVLSIHN